MITATFNRPAGRYRDGRSGEGQAQQHQQGDDLMVGVDVGQA